MHKVEFVVLHLGCYFYDNISAITSLAFFLPQVVYVLQGGVYGSTPGLLFLRKHFYDKIISVFSLESTTSGCVYTTRGSLTWAAISTITSLAYFL